MSLNVTLIIATVLLVCGMASSVYQSTREDRDWFSSGNIQFGWRGTCSPDPVGCLDYSEMDSDDGDDLRARGLASVACSALHGLLAAAMVILMGALRFEGERAGMPITIMAFAGVSVGSLAAKLQQLADDGNFNLTYEAASIVGIVSALCYAAAAVLGGVSGCTKC